MALGLSGLLIGWLTPTGDHRLIHANPRPTLVFAAPQPGPRPSQRTAKPQRTTGDSLPNPVKLIANPEPAEGLTRGLANSRQPHVNQ